MSALGKGPGMMTRGRGGRPGSIGRGLLGKGVGLIGGLRGKAMRSKRRGRRGITGAQLRGFNRVAGLLAKFGMVPKKLGRRGARVRAPQSR
jgi:hypothetical protein